MELLRDDAIIECAMRTGYAPWIKDDPYEDEEKKVNLYSERRSVNVRSQQLFVLCGIRYEELCMNNKEILKVMAEVLPVRHGERKFQRVVDYSANGDIYGTIRYTAGCIDERNKYWSVSSSELVCDIDLSNTNLKKPVWTSPYTTATVIQAIKDKTPVTVGSYQFRRISRLSTIVDRVTGEYRYVAACEDLYGNIVVARVEQVSITGTNQRLEERRSGSHEE